MKKVNLIPFLLYFFDKNITVLVLTVFKKNLELLGSVEMVELL